MTIQSDSGRANSLTDWTREFSRGWNWDGIFLSFFSRQAKSVTVFLSRLLIVPHTSMDCTSPTILKAFSLPPLGYVSHRSGHRTGSSLGDWTKAYGQGYRCNEVGS